MPFFVLQFITVNNNINTSSTINNSILNIKINMKWIENKKSNERFNKKIKEFNDVIDKEIFELIDIVEKRI